MWILPIVFYTIGSLGTILTVLPLFKFGMWWIRIGEFPRLQIAFGSAEITQEEPTATIEEEKEAVETIVETLELIKDEN